MRGSVLAPRPWRGSGAAGIGGGVQGGIRTEHEELVLVHRAELLDLAVHGTRVADSLHDVAGASLTLGADHGRALADAAQRLAQVAAAAHERNLRWARAASISKRVRQDNRQKASWLAP